MSDNEHQYPRYDEENICIPDYHERGKRYQERSVKGVPDIIEWTVCDKLVILAQQVNLRQVKGAVEPNHTQ